MKKKVLIIIAVLAGIGLVCLISKMKRKRKVQDLSERLRYGQHNDDLNVFEEELYKMEEETDEDEA